MKYFLEIQDLPLPLRIHVNTTLSTVDTAPGCWQKMEWISEARVVLRWHRDSLENDKDGLKSCLALEEKIRAAELGLRKQMGIPEYDDYDDDDGSGDEDCDEQDEDEMKDEDENEDEYEAESEDQDNIDDGEVGDADDQAISALK